MHHIILVDVGRLGIQEKLPEGQNEKCTDHINEKCATIYDEEEMDDIFKAVPSRTCTPTPEEICMNVACPAIWKTKRCEAKQVLDVEMVPKVIPSKLLFVTLIMD